MEGFDFSDCDLHYHLYLSSVKEMKTLPLVPSLLIFEWIAKIQIHSSYGKLIFMILH